MLVNSNRPRNIVYFVVVVVLRSLGILGVASIVAGSAYKYCCIGIVKQLLGFRKATCSVQRKALGSELARNIAYTILTLLLSKYLIGLCLYCRVYILGTKHRLYGWKHCF